MRKTARVAISYRNYWDLPRIFVAKWRRKLLLFECPFDEEREDFEDYFVIYELPSALANRLATRSWVGLANEGRYIGRVAVKDVRFPFEHGAPVVGIRSPIPKDESHPMGGFELGWIDDEVFEKLDLD